MRFQLILDFDGSPQELLALLPTQIDIQSFQRLSAEDNGHAPGIVKLSGARNHMTEQTVAQIYAAFDAGQTIEQIGARTGFSYRAVAARRRSWKQGRGL
jgi:hypothetical protein